MFFIKMSHISYMIQMTYVFFKKNYIKAQTFIFETG